MIKTHIEHGVVTKFAKYKDWQHKIIFEYVIIYVLLINTNFYYVGSTTNLTKRLRTHRKRKGSIHTKNYQTLQLIENYLIPNIMFYEAEIYESFLTIKYAKRYGYKNINGGSFVSIADGIYKALKTKSFASHSQQFNTDDSSYLDRLYKFKVDIEYNFVKKITSPQLKLL